MTKESPCTPTPPPPLRAPSPANPSAERRAVGLVATLILGVLSYQLNASMITPALPDIADQLGEDIGQVSQVSSLFFVAGAVGGVVLGRWSDFIGRKRALFIVLGILSVGTLLCLFAPNLTVLLIGRVLQGASSAAFQLAYVILSESLSAKVFGTTLGIITAVNGGVGGVDGYIGGLLSETFGFRSIFVVIFLVGLMAIVCVARVIPASAGGASTGKMDWWGAAVLSIALICVTYFVSSGPSAGWLAPITLLYLGGHHRRAGGVLVRREEPRDPADRRAAPALAPGVAGARDHRPHPVQRLRRHQLHRRAAQPGHARTASASTPRPPRCSSSPRPR